MYITTSTYGGIDWHDSRTIYEPSTGIMPSDSFPTLQ